MRGFFPRLARWLGGRSRDALDRLRLLQVEPGAWLADRSSRSRFTTLDETQLRGLVRSNTCFIFGSGRSLDQITPPEWEAISSHNTIAFNYFSVSRFVRVDVHMVGEMVCPDPVNPAIWRPVVQEYGRLIEENPFYADTVLGLQEGLRALQSNRLVASGAIRSGRRVFRYRRIARGLQRPPSHSLRDGLVHGAGTLVGCINLAVILGFKDIVLAGVDLYDGHLFANSETGAVSRWESSNTGEADKPHLTAHTMVNYLGPWGRLLSEQGVTLSVYNARSLLAQVLPVKARLI